VGGVTGAAETRAMAEVIAALIAERDGGSGGAGPDQKHS
jgi:hypothetical protein